MTHIIIELLLTITIGIVAGKEISLSQKLKNLTWEIHELEKNKKNKE